MNSYIQMGNVKMSGVNDAYVQACPRLLPPGWLCEDNYFYNFNVQLKY